VPLAYFPRLLWAFPEQRMQYERCRIEGPKKSPQRVHALHQIITLKAARLLKLGQKPPIKAVKWARLTLFSTFEIVKLSNQRGQARTNPP
jgi:hypothetical protein